MPKPDRPLSARERWMFRHLPVTQRIWRTALYWMLESRVLGFTIHPSLMKTAQKIALQASAQASARSRIARHA